MKLLLAVSSIGAALFAVWLYNLSPSYPVRLEGVTFLEKLQNAFAMAIFKLSVTAECYGLVDTVVVFRRLINLGFRDVKTLIAENPDVEVEGIKIADVPVIISRPLNSRNRSMGALIYFHGGAFFFLSAETHFLWTKLLTLEADIVVISVNYRLAPEHPFPAAIEDCLKVTKAVIDDAAKYGVDPSKIVVAGESAGGNLATLVAIELATSEKYKLKGQVLISPAVQGSETLPSTLVYENFVPFHFGYIGALYGDFQMACEYHHDVQSAVHARRHLSKADEEILNRYVNVSSLSEDLKPYRPHDEPAHQLEVSDQSLTAKLSPYVQKILKKIRNFVLNEKAWPLLTSDEEKLRKMCPAYISVSEFDVLRDEGLLYYDRLRSLGARVTFRYMEGVAHAGPPVSVLMGRPLSESVRTKYIPEIIDFIKSRLAADD